MGLGKFKPNKQTGGNFSKALHRTRVLYNFKAHQQSWISATLFICWIIFGSSLVLDPLNWADHNTFEGLVPLNNFCNENGPSLCEIKKKINTTVTNN